VVLCEFFVRGLRRTALGGADGRRKEIGFLGYDFLYLFWILAEFKLVERIFRRNDFSAASEGMLTAVARRRRRGGCGKAVERLLGGGRRPERRWQVRSLFLPPDFCCVRCLTNLKDFETY
jgi:hypothetical protein